jgi:hypothetical protein
VSTLVVLALVAAAVGALGFLLTKHGGRGRRRHGGGSPVVPRALVTVVPLLAATAVVWPFRDHTELLLAALGLWWASVPWLAFTGRLSVWGHASWTLATNGGAAGLVYIAWLITSTGLSVPAALGCWALWAVVAAAFVLFAVWTRRAASVASVGLAESGSTDGAPTGGRAALRERRDLTTPRPAFSAAWVAGAAAAVALALVLQPSAPATPAASTGTTPATPAEPTDATSEPGRPAPSVPSAEATAPTTDAVNPAARSEAPTRPPSSTSVARGGPRTTTTAAPRPPKPSKTSSTASPTSSSLFTLTIGPSRKKPRPSETKTTDDD